MYADSVQENPGSPDSSDQGKVFKNSSHLYKKIKFVYALNTLESGLSIIIFHTFYYFFVDFYMVLWSYGSLFPCGFNPVSVLSVLHIGQRVYTRLRGPQTTLLFCQAV